MKQLIILLAFIFASTYGFSQVHFPPAKAAPMAALIKSDTLEILDIKQIRFIKIGDNIYEIKSPTLEKVEIPPSFSPRFFTFPTDTAIHQRYFLPALN